MASGLERLECQGSCWGRGRKYTVQKREDHEGLWLPTALRRELLKTFSGGSVHNLTVVNRSLDEQRGGQRRRRPRVKTPMWKTW